MKIEKFEGYQSGDYDYEWGGHVFVLARYKGGWDKFYKDTSFKNEEFVPCMIGGHIENKYQKQNFWIIGSDGSHDIDAFEILEGSDKGIQEMIKLYSATKKYNL